MLAAGHAQGDGKMGLAGTDAADQHDVGSLGDEGAAAQLQDRVAVQLRLRVELEGIQGLEHREAGLLEAALDAALAAPGHFQVHQLREVLRGRLALAGGLGGQRPPLGGHRRQAQGLEVGHQVCGGSGTATVRRGLPSRRHRRPTSGRGPRSGALVR